LAFAAFGAFGMMSQVTISNTILQTTADASMRGRVISLYAMIFFGLQPIGSLTIGFVSQHIGVENTVLIEGIIALLIGALDLYALRKIKSGKKISQIKNPEAEAVAMQI
jgi:MFS family permease